MVALALLSRASHVCIEGAATAPIREHPMPLRRYLAFAAGQPRLLAFGFVGALSSSFGQTYFIGIFGPAIQADLGLSHTAWGAIYMAGTLLSALVLPWTGRLIDDLDLRVYTVLVCLFGAAACTAAALATGVASLVLAIFALRQAGQGLMSHTAITSVARYFETGRGRAIAVASLGFSVGEAVLPVGAVLVISSLGWRTGYAIAGATLTLVLIPVALWLLAGHGERHRGHAASLLAAAGSGRGEGDWTRAQVLRDRRFYLLLPGLLAPSVIQTAMFFHHLNLADAKGWSHAWITGSYAIYALAGVVVSLVSGMLIDRYEARSVVRTMLVPLALALVVVAGFDDRWTAWLYLALLGVNTGIAHTGIAALWAELYGVSHLGAIRSLATSCSVLGSALGPVIVGTAMDRGATIEAVCIAFAVFCVVASGALVAALWEPPRAPRAQSRPS